MEEWMKMIDMQPFATTPEPLQLMDVVTSLVSRAQLIEWGKWICRRKRVEEGKIYFKE